jgi:hypothetical protein
VQLVQVEQEEHLVRLEMQAAPVLQVQVILVLLLVLQEMVLLVQVE